MLNVTGSAGGIAMRRAMAGSMPSVRPAGACCCARLAPVHRSDAREMAAKDVEIFMNAPVFQPVLVLAAPHSGLFLSRLHPRSWKGKCGSDRQIVNAAFCLWGIWADNGCRAVRGAFVRRLLIIPLVLVPTGTLAQTAADQLTKAVQEIQCTRPDRTLIKVESNGQTQWTSQSIESAKYDRQVKG